MEFPNIQEYLGNDWLKKQIEFIESAKWIKDTKGIQTNEIIATGYFVLEKIDEFIQKFRNCKGFHKWAAEAKTTKKFEDCLFELMSMEIFIDKSDTLEIKKDNYEKVPEAWIKKDDASLFLECTRLKAIPKSIENTVTNLFSKSRKRFKYSEGVHIVGTLGFFDEDTQKPSPQLNLLKFYIERRFSKGMGSTIAAFILTNFYVALNPRIHKNSLVREYILILNPNKEKYSADFFKNLLTVTEFINFN